MLATWNQYNDMFIALICIFEIRVHHINTPSWDFGIATSDADI